MPQTTLNIQIDSELKKQFDALCSDIGMNMSTAFIIFAKKAVRERRIPFELTANSETEPPQVGKRIGAAKGKLHIPDDFDKWDKEIEKLFEDGDMF